MKQRLLKLAILLFTPIALIASLGAYAGTFWYYFSGVKYLASADSPNGQYRSVIVRARDSHTYGTDGDTFVVVERRFWILKTGEFVPFGTANEDTKMAHAIAAKQNLKLTEVREPGYSSPPM